MITLKLTDRDYMVLCGVLGGYMAMPDERKLSGEAWKELSDWILIQGGNENTYTYFHDKQELRFKKESELKLEEPQQ